jgi:ubiquinone/menaquinone biosynthesis C-methylase UbiE
MTTVTSLEEVKARQQKMWGSGDYGKVAWLTVPLADVLCEAVDLRPGAKVLDVATGTGHVALAAARRFCMVIGTDYVAALLDAARRRAEAEALPVRFEEADAEDLPCADDDYDYVLSAIGTMFAPDHARTAGELVRVCKPGGVIGTVNWTPSGFVGEMFKAVSAHVPPPAGMQPPTLWGKEAHQRELFGDRVSGLSCTTGTVTQRFLSAAHFAEFFIGNYGPTLKAAEALDEAGREAFRRDLIALGDRFNRAEDGPLVCDWEYLVAVATKA